MKKVEEKATKPKAKAEVERKAIGYSLTAMTLGILSVIMGFFSWISFPSALLAIGFGIVGKLKEEDSMAMTGMILGSIGLVLSIIVAVIWGGSIV